MENSLNNEIKDEITQAIINSDWGKMNTLRNSKGDVGSVLYIDSLDLSGRDLSNIPGDFLCFKNCNLTKASFDGKKFFPISFWNCDARGLDLSNTSGMLFAYGTDFRGVKNNNSTKLTVDNSDLISAFKDCQMDDDFRDFIINQGVELEFLPEQNIGYYAFGLSDDLLKLPILIKDIINEIDGFLNDKSLPKDQIASYIVGSTMMRDDYDDIIKIEPEIETLAEMASDFEVTAPENKNIDIYFNDILLKIKLIKNKYNL